MIVKAIFKNKDFDYFRDVQTNDKRYYGDIFECDDEIAQERIKNKFVKKATKEEEKQYKDNLKPSSDETTEGNTGDNEETNSNEGELPKNDDESAEIKSLEKCTMEELIQIAQDENIKLSYPKDNTAHNVIIETINKVRNERLEQKNNG